MATKPKGPTWNQVGASLKAGDGVVVVRDSACFGYSSRQNGRSYYTLRCPFCKNDVIATIWSMRGCGKRCTCGALIGSSGQAHHFATVADKSNG